MSCYLGSFEKMKNCIRREVWPCVFIVSRAEGIVGVCVYVGPKEVFPMYCV